MRATVDTQLQSVKVAAPKSIVYPTIRRNFYQLAPNCQQSNQKINQLGSHRHQKGPEWRTRGQLRKASLYTQVLRDVGHRICCNESPQSACRRRRRRHRATDKFAFAIAVTFVQISCCYPFALLI